MRDHDHDRPEGGRDHELDRDRVAKRKRARLIRHHDEDRDQRRPLDDMVRDMERGVIIRHDDREDFARGFGSFP